MADRTSRIRRPLHVLAAAGAAAHHGVELGAGKGGGPPPYLIAAEGLPARSLPAYNAVLWAWGAAAVAALLRETPRRLAALAVPGAVLALALRGSARRHFDW